jgi:Rps23 Pro-64 3,4-dihydroxylase Tpa1-like proline 4-hydroxylase
VHTDSKSKIITVLLYLNSEPWLPFGGRLRLLNAEDLEAVAAEVKPDFGTLLVFCRSDRSWHGHLPYEGPRRILQMNWVTSEGVAAWEKFRHAVSARVKHLT